ncbi:MAG: hypothetical protein PHC97_00945 [Patescibacteria group bacterium]|nr:hypothetical protein [Patescibacteria group bacterium]
MEETIGVNPSFFDPESVKSETGLATATFDGEMIEIEEVVIEI